MQETSLYRVIEDVLSAHLAGEAVLLDMRTKNYFQLNATAACVWKGLERGLEREALLETLSSEFEVDQRTAEAALDQLLADLAGRELIVTCEAPGGNDR